VYWNLLRSFDFQYSSSKCFLIQILTETKHALQFLKWVPSVKLFIFSNCRYNLYCRSAYQIRTENTRIRTWLHWFFPLMRWISKIMF
jgi:hypothetical protein